MASHSGSTANTSEQLYGTRPSVWHRWPSAKILGDIHREIDACYPSKVVFRKWFDEKGKKLITGALENPRMVLSSQRRYKKRIFEEGRGISQGQEGSNEDETELFGGKQLAHAFYMAYEQDSANSNVQRVLQHVYQVNIRPRTLPLDVKIEIVKHSNRHHDGIKITVPEMIARVAEGSASCCEFFASQIYELERLVRRKSDYHITACTRNMRKRTMRRCMVGSGRHSTRRKSFSTNGSTSLLQTRRRHCLL